MKNIGAALVTFRTLEIGQDLLPRPALASKRCPVVIVGVMAADIDHAVDRARSAQRLAARLVASASVEPRLRHCLEGPVVDFRFARQHCRHADRRPDDNTPTLAAGLDQADGDLVIFRKASRERRAGRAAACEDIIVCHASPSLVRCYYLRQAQPVANASEAAARKRSAADIGRCLLGLQQLVLKTLRSVIDPTPLRYDASAGSNVVCSPDAPVGG